VVGKRCDHCSEALHEQLVSGLHQVNGVLETVLDLIVTSLDGMDFLMAAKKDLDHFLQKMSIFSEVEAIGRSLKRRLSQLNVRPQIDPDSFPRLREAFVTGRRRES